MTVFLLRRLAFFFGTLIAGSILIFAFIRLAGGDVVTTTLGQDATPQAAAQLRHEYGLDRSVVVQYLEWVRGLLTGDLGVSYRTEEGIGSMIVDRLPITIPLCLAALLLAVAIAVPAGTLMAKNAGNALGAVGAMISQIGIAVPVFWAGVLLSLVFGVELGWLPTGDWTPWSESVGDAIRSLVLPTVALGLILAATLTRYVRTAVLEVMSQDFVRTARATGMTRGQALLRVGLRNASLPIVTVLGLLAAELLGGTVIIETVFSLPGLSRMILGAVSAREVIVVQSTVMVLVTFVMLLNLLVDVLYGILDPRVRVTR
jgi:peptide/nickel transport system permease protein